MTALILKIYKELGSKSIEGFLTSNNRFVNRKEAGEISFKAKQTDILKSELYSEDIY